MLAVKMSVLILLDLLAAVDITDHKVLLTCFWKLERMAGDSEFDLSSLRPQTLM